MAAALAFAEPRIPLVSALTGELAGGRRWPSRGTGCGSVREPVRFADAVRGAGRGGGAGVRRGGPGRRRCRAMGRRRTPARGRRVRCGCRRCAGTGGEAAVAGRGAGRGCTCAAWRWTGRRCWAGGPAGGPADVRVPAAAVLAAAGPVAGRTWRRRGWAAAGHPLLGAAVELAGRGGAGADRAAVAGGRSRGWLIMWWPGRCCCRGRRSWSWRSGPGTRPGAGGSRSWRWRRRWCCPPTAGSRCRSTVGGAGRGGRRAVEVYARPADAGADGPWTRHASGLLAPAARSRTPAGGRAGGVAAGRARSPVDLAGLYAELAAGGLRVRAGVPGAAGGVAARGGGVRRGGAAGGGAPAERAFGLHPALLDAALHAAGLAGAAAAAGRAAVRLPFAWSGVSLHAAGASALRVRLRAGRPAAGCRLAAADGAGSPVVSVDVAGAAAGGGGAAGRGRGGLREALFARGVGAGPGGRRGRRAGGRWAVAGRWRRGWRRPARCAVYPDLAALAAAVGAGEPVPEVVLACAGAGGAAAAPACGRRGRWRGGCWGWCRSGWPRSGWRRRGWWW